MIKENSFDASPGTCVSTAKPISPARAGPEDPASVRQLIGGLFLLFSSSSSSTNHPLKGMGLLKTHLTLFSLSEQMESRKKDTVVAPERQTTQGGDSSPRRWGDGLFTGTGSQQGTGGKAGATPGCRLPALGFLPGMPLAPLLHSAPPSRVRPGSRSMSSPGSLRDRRAQPSSARICTPR